MKKSIFQFVFILTLCCQYINVNAQFITNGTGAIYGETDNTIPIDAIGIGNFTTPGATPNAALDIIVPYLSNNGLIYQGEAFRTKVDSKYDHTWKMWTFPETPKFFVLNPGTVLLPGHLAYDGSASVNDIHLNLIQKGNMNFFTNNTLWMRLREQGYFGLSDDWRTFSPLSLLHLNQKGNANLFAQWTNGNTGINVSDGLRIGVEYNGGYTGANKSFAKIIQQEDAPMKFYTNNTDRMIINSGYTPTIHLQNVNTTGYVGIGANNFWGEESGGEGPRSLLHLQGPFNAFTNGGNGWRTWNKTGIYINENSDEMYVGLKNEFVSNGTNRSDAVIMWGDDQANFNDGTADNFRLIFSGGTGNGAGNGGTNPRDPLTLNGLETMRMTPFGKMGIGPLFNFAIPPSRRLEILDYQNTSGASMNEPQFRLTFTQTTTPGTGIFTDFQTMFNGHLYVDPRNGGTKTNVGISTNNPREKLEINSNDAGAVPGNSGLQFTDLTSFSTITASSFTGNPKGVLSVNANGKVILVADETVSPSSGLNTCTSGIPDNYVLKMDVSTTNTVCKSLIYDDGANVGIDVPSLLPLQKLDVNGNVNIRGTAITSGIYFNNSKFVSTGGPSSSNVYLGTSAGPTTAALTGYSNICIGGNTGTSMNSSETDNIMIGQNAGTNLSGAGVGDNTLIGRSAGLNVTNGLENTFIGYNAGTNYSSNNHNTAIGSFAASAATGVTGDNNTFVGYQASTTNGSTFNNSTAIGVYSSVDASDCLVLGNVNGVTPTNVGTRVLIGYTNPSTAISTDYRLYVNAGANSNAAFFNGNLYSMGLYLPSDSSLKTNIQPISNSSSILNQLQPKTYNFDQANNPALVLPAGIQYGLLSDDVSRVLPGLVKEVTAPSKKDANGNVIAAEQTFNALNYTGLIPLLVQGFKEQQETIDSLMMRLNNLEIAMSACCISSSNQRTSTNGIDIELTSENSIILNQNDPNPFAEQTRISFNVPTDVIEAKIIFFDNSGHVLQTVKINERGAGQINVYGEKLSSGIYSYSLIADGKVIDTKKMVCVK